MTEAFKSKPLPLRFTSVFISDIHLGFGYWPLAAFLKHEVKNAVQYISNFESVVAYEVARMRVDGVVCGHIHRAEIARIDGIVQCNCGDWVESCTAMVEHHDRSLETVRWSDTVSTDKTLQAAA